MSKYLQQNGNRINDRYLILESNFKSVSVFTNRAEKYLDGDERKL
jgi:hypothetical protein